MSTRTFIEINHDFLSEMENNGHISEELRRALASGDGRVWLGNHNIPGMRFIGQRHHSEDFVLKIGSREAFKED